MVRLALDSAFYRRLAVTAAVLAAYRLGCHLPLPGLDGSALAQLDAGALERTSILALGIMPVLNALILMELLRLIAPGVRRWEAASPHNAARMSAIGVGLVLVMALLQAAGYVAALEDIAGLVSEPGTPFRAASIATLIGGTALAMAFIAVIDRAGLGWGLWLLFLANGLAELPPAVATLAALNLNGGYGVEHTLLAAVFTALAIAGVASIVLAARAAPATVAACLWTPIIAFAVIGPLLFAVGLIATWNVDAAAAFAAPDGVGWYIAVAAVVASVAWLYLRSWRLAGSASPVPAAPLAAILAAILLASGMLQQQLGVVLPLNGTQLIVAAAVATSMLLAWGRVSGAPMADATVSPRA